MLSQSYGFYVSVVYFTIYAAVFVIGSIYSAKEVYSSSNGLKKFLMNWRKSLWTKKSIYFAVVPHIFDQASDIGVLWTYYELWKDNTQSQYTDINGAYLFFSSLAVIIVHKIISTAVVYSITGSVLDILLQILDLMLVKAVYVNYKLETNEPGNAQRLLQLLEGVFESGPQIFISLVYLIKIQESDPIVWISIITSLWTISSRVNSDDKFIVKEEYKNPEYSKSCPFVNTRYVFRVISRFLEITNRVVMLCLVWIVIGGFTMGIILFIEVAIVFILSIWSKDVMVLGYLMYFSVADEDSPVPIQIQKTFLTYRIISPFFYSIIVTIFVSVPIEAWKVPDFEARHELIVQQSVGLLALIYCWVSSLVSAVSLKQMEYFALQSGSKRQIRSLLRWGRFGEIKNLLEFGFSVDKLLFSHSGYNFLHFIVGNNRWTEDNVVKICNIAMQADGWNDLMEGSKTIIHAISHHEQFRSAYGHLLGLVRDCKIHKEYLTSNDQCLQFMARFGCTDTEEIIQLLCPEFDFKGAEIELDARLSALYKISKYKVSLRDLSGQYVSRFGILIEQCIGFFVTDSEDKRLNLRKLVEQIKYFILMDSSVWLNVIWSENYYSVSLTQAAALIYSDYPELLTWMIDQGLASDSDKLKPDEGIEIFAHKPKSHKTTHRPKLFHVYTRE
eukprot:520831_1